MSTKNSEDATTNSGNTKDIKNPEKLLLLQNVIQAVEKFHDSFGIEKLYLTGTSATPPKYKIRKAARSADHRIPFEYHTSALELINTLKQQGYLIISLEITQLSQNLREFVIQNKHAICLIIGAENKGIDQALLDLSDHCIHIPMHGENSSMNVTTACAIALYELVRFY